MPFWPGARRDKQDLIEVFGIAGRTGAHQARKASQMPPIQLFFDAATLRSTSCHFVVKNKNLKKALFHFGQKNNPKDWTKTTSVSKVG